MVNIQNEKNEMVKKYKSGRNTKWQKCFMVEIHYGRNS